MINKIQILLYISLNFLSFSVLAYDIYPRGSECEVLPEAPEVQFSTTYKTRKKDSQEQSLDKVKQRLLQKTEQALEKYNTSLVVKSMNFKKHSDGTLIAKSSFIPVISCSKHTPVITNTTLDLFSNHVMHSKRMMSLGYNMVVNKVPSKIAELKLESNLASPNKVFGIPFGDKLHEVEQKIGRFSMLWPIAEGAHLGFIGRDHVLFFSNNTFVGYQYNESLLPIYLRNQLELFNEQVQVYNPTNNTTYLGGTELTPKYAMGIQSTYDNVQVVKVKVSNEKLESRLVGFSIGDVSLVERKLKKLPCPDIATAFNEISVQEAQLVKLYDYNGKRSYLTGCHQKVNLNQYGTVTSVELLDPISGLNMELRGGQRLLEGLNSWQFALVSQGDPIKAISGKELGERTFDVVEWSNERWQGHFVLEHNKVVAGEMVPIEL
ncbi:hypothetical protein CWB96_17600 [Pseudoalteromonas citrea]|uniref:Uncharacterized protein n=1 Tax=Pseudoalteromonas citrea TaxID=43655 RepID=A0A5S3XME1_9GAMM|nr:hypothetical protein [Pseudoalteromonas citrea]TMP43787.1 hypothetical protein CWB97_07995 [Pseudoalteromonas citrea]TMP55337.1 hypothetical protein CWB96_17600 [Pseudoalteromonas citrea]